MGWGEKDAGRPSWPVGPGKGNNKKTVRDSKDGKTCSMAAIPVAIAAWVFTKLGR